MRIGMCVASPLGVFMSCIVNLADNYHTFESKENLDTGMFSGPPCTSKCLQPALDST